MRLLLGRLQVSRSWQCQQHDHGRGGTITGGGTTTSGSNTGTGGGGFDVHPQEVIATARGSLVGIPLRRLSAAAW
jgi:hypothetical protein